jgi:hypothetical protein
MWHAPFRWSRQFRQFRQFRRFFRLFDQSLFFQRFSSGMTCVMRERACSSGMMPCSFMMATHLSIICSIEMSGSVKTPPA